MWVLIEDKAPDQLDLPYALWGRAAGGESITQAFGIRLPASGCRCEAFGHLKRWGFMPQKPLRRAYEQSPAVVRR